MDARSKFLRALQQHRLASMEEVKVACLSAQLLKFSRTRRDYRPVYWKEGDVKAILRSARLSTSRSFLMRLLLFFFSRDYSRVVRLLSNGEEDEEAAAMFGSRRSARSFEIHVNVSFKYRAVGARALTGDPPPAPPAPAPAPPPPPPPPPDKGKLK